MDGTVKTDPAAAGLTPVSLSPDRKKSMEKAAEGFESFFIFSMLKEMGKTAQLTREELHGGDRDVDLLREGGRLHGQEGDRDKRSDYEISDEERC